MNPHFSRRSFLATTAGGLSLAIASPMLAVGAKVEAAAMPLRPLGKTGRMISIIGFGGGSRYLLQEDTEVAERMIHRSIELGINYFDTGHSYRKGEVRESQQRYGRFLVPSYRKQITLTTKLAARDAETAKRQLDETLSDLKTDHIDVLHFHGLSKTDDIDKILAKDGAIKAYRKWKDQGVIGSIGVTGHQDGKVILEAMKRIEPDCVMCPQNPWHSAKKGGPLYPGVDFANDVIPYALDHGIGLLAMKTMAQGRLIGRGGITAEDLMQYALTLPMAAATIGMPDMEVLESCAMLARRIKPMSDKQRDRLCERIVSAATADTFPYLADGYVDGQDMVS
ncbi:MAG: aldo/keto reductase [Phycisphaerales bacterium]|nr:MAG: aldo/keto reductase [Phycisphaerales bacterium]